MKFSKFNLMAFGVMVTLAVGALTTSSFASRGGSRGGGRGGSVAGYVAAGLGGYIVGRLMGSRGSSRSNGYSGGMTSGGSGYSGGGGGSEGNPYEEAQISAESRELNKLFDRNDATFKIAKEKKNALVAQALSNSKIPSGAYLCTGYCGNLSDKGVVHARGLLAVGPTAAVAFQKLTDSCKGEDEVFHDLREEYTKRQQRVQSLIQDDETETCDTKD